MDIKLPSTLTAEYEPKLANEYPFERPGQVVIRFGRIAVDAVPVTEAQHDELNADGFYTSHEGRETALEEIVAGWLKEKWGL